MLQNARFTHFIVAKLMREKRQGGEGCGEEFTW